MSRKLNSVEQDILSELQKIEPDMLLWREIRARLWPRHKKRYKDKEVFGVALSNYLTKHKDRLWKHEGDYWGTLESLPTTRDRPSLWDRLKHSFEQAGGYSVKIAIQRASYAGRDPLTGWRLYDHNTEDSIEAIMVLKGATALVAISRSFEIYIKGEHDGLLLTSGQIKWKDHTWWKDKLYEVKDVEERYDGYNFSYNIAYLTELPHHREERETAEVDARSMISDGRSQTRIYLTTYLTDARIVKDEGSAKASYCVIYTNPPYPIINDFLTSDSPVDGLYAIGEPESAPLFSADQTIYGYEEHVPIFIFTVDKAGATGAKLEGRMEAELRLPCETHPI